MDKGLNGVLRRVLAVSAVSVTLVIGAFTPAAAAPIDDAPVPPEPPCSTPICIDKDFALFTWELEKLRGRGGPTGAVIGKNYDQVDASATSPVALRACDSTAAAGIQSYRWSFSNGAAPFTTTKCSAVWNRPLSNHLSSVDVTLTIQPISGPAFSNTRKVTFWDVVIASLGDSAASGEGAPDGPVGNRFLISNDCDRSGWAANAQAALKAQKNLPDATVHFWDLTCAGASITGVDSSSWPNNHPADLGGMLEPYTGVHHNVTNPPLKPQLVRLRELRTRTGLRIDRLLLTVGANDTHWATVAADCLKKAVWPPPPPPLPGVDTEQVKCIKEYTPDVVEAIGVLPGHFKALNQALDETLVSRDRIYLNEYFDPMDSLAEQPLLCGLNPLQYPTVGDGEYAASKFLRVWAVDTVETPLQDAVQAAAGEYGWNYISGIRRAFQGHGICQRGDARWINTAMDSGLHQGDIYGTWHANQKGHQVMADIVYKNISAGLFTQPAPDIGFDPVFYLQRYPDLAVALHNDLNAARLHWVNRGLPIEGRRGSVDFDVKFYLAHNPDVATGVGGNYRVAYEHWVNRGLPIEGRRGSVDFDVKCYLARYPTVAASVGGNYSAGLNHWIRTGRAQGLIGTCNNG
jgi:hypothetical protein